MKLDNVLKRVCKLDGDWNTRAFTLEGDEQGKCCWRFEVDWDGGSSRKPRSSKVSLPVADSWKMAASFDGLDAEVTCEIGSDGRWIDESVTLTFADENAKINDLSIGMELDLADLDGFRATPIPFRVSLKGESQVIDLSSAADGAYYAEGWVVEDGEEGFLVMRVPTGSAYTCFVPLVVRTEDTRRTLQVGSLGPDGSDHRERSCYLDTAFAGGKIEFPKTRILFFRGDWRTGFEIFRQMAAQSIARTGEPRRKPCPISYNTYHDFGPKYDREKIFELMPMLSEMGFGLIHLDPGWETVWGSNIWGEDHMGDLDELVAEARRNGLEVGCWTSVHSTDPDVHGDNYTRNQAGEKFYAEDFAIMNPEWNRLWGSCPASEYQNTALANLSRLGKAGFRFLNSDFHDWPWMGEGCWSKDHWHKGWLTRPEWCEALNQLYVRLHEACPDMVLELHDHVESGEYRTPVWYMYDRPGSYDEKWAYEFMWHTFENLMDHKLFSLYYVRLAEPIPMFLHMHASSDNEHAIAFWYIASCVNHVGVGAILKSSEKQRESYKKAFAEYNARFEAFSSGTFHGIDELTHVHVYPDRRRAVIVAFNLTDEEVTREFKLEPKEWDMNDGGLSVEGAKLSSEGLVQVVVPAQGVVLVDLVTG